ncbi:MAG: squalene--hopene cyclase [Tannerellaceae bacterium]|jgi:squalene-hopene/tetraprenyl-beta-curcumene cyclase|nr:squalene--hopene cyclase [Tannerellaceae bacterium]
MLNLDHIKEMTEALGQQLKAGRSPKGIWRGKLSSSAISTAVSIFALYQTDQKRHNELIHAGARWLRSTMWPDGSWGDTPESRSNMTATLLSHAALFALNEATTETQTFLAARFGGITNEKIVQGVLSYYGKDLTFSVPILVMCALSGLITDWRHIPRLPFELAILPQRFFRFLQLPVVSYAIPALIAVGILRHRKGKKGIGFTIRESFVTPSLKVLETLQPSGGGFLEAAPLTAFVTICMSSAGYNQHSVTQRAIGFLTDNVRPNGSWPIDTDLACWVTALSIKALGEDVPDREFLLQTVKNQAFRYRHPFTGAKEGGWGWSDLPGAVPDADDTAGNLIALHILQRGVYCPEAEKGVRWLLDLQNKDGGIPTFCKGWGRLPFDSSSPDLSAHALAAFERWYEVLPERLQRKCRKSIRRILRWMQKTQASDGSWTPLWFGDQDTPNEHAPVYGTAVAVEYLNLSTLSPARELAAKGAAYLVSVQNEDGGWGGAKGYPSKVTLTARALSALAHSPDKDRETLARGVDYLYRRFKEGTLGAPEPIGLYFARLWYSEELYNPAFALHALKNLLM